MSPVQRQRPSGESPLHRNPEPISTGATAPRHPGISAVKAAQPGRTAYTWRLTSDEAVLLDSLALRLRGDLGHRLDRATWLITLCRLAADDPAIYQALRAELEDA